MNNDKCPFCGARVQVPNRLYRCGTEGPDEVGNYKTGRDCDVTCFRRSYLRCLDLLRDIDNELEEAESSHVTGNFQPKAFLSDKLCDRIKEQIK